LTLPSLSSRTSLHPIPSPMADLRYAFRLLRKNPAFTAVAVLVIMLGTGAVTTIFSVVDALLLRPAPSVGASEALVNVIRAEGDGRGFHVFSYPMYRDLRDRTRTLDGLAAYAGESFHIGLSPHGEREAVTGNLVSGNYFDVLRMKPQLGRFFLAEEDRTPLTHPVLVVSDAFWRERLGGDRAALQRYRTMLTAIRDKVRAQKAKGATLEQVLADKPTAEFDPQWGKGMMRPNDFVALVYAGV